MQITTAIHESSVFSSLVSNHHLVISSIVHAHAMVASVIGMGFVLKVKNLVAKSVSRIWRGPYPQAMAHMHNVDLALLLSLSA